MMYQSAILFRTSACPEHNHLSLFSYIYISEDLAAAQVERIKYLATAKDVNHLCQAFSSRL